MIARTDKLGRRWLPAFIFAREDPLDRTTFEAAMNHRAPDATTVRLTQRFEFAFRASRDLQTAMAAVNELLEQPLTYQQFFAALRR